MHRSSAAAPESSPGTSRAQAPRHLTALAALAGVLAAALTLGVAEVVAAVVAPTASPVLAIGSAFIDRVPSWLKTFAVETFGSNDKTVLLASMGVVVALLAALAGVLELRRRGAGPALVAVLGLVSVGAAVTRAGAGALQALPSVVGFVAGALVLRALVARLRGLTSRPAGQGSTGQGSTGATRADGASRRSFLVAFGATAAVAGATGIGGRVLGSAARGVAAARARLVLPRAATPAPPLPAGVSAGVPGVTPFVTPNADFYRVDTALAVPRIDPATWSLRIHGLVEREVHVTYQDLLDAELVESRVTLTCVSNEVGGSYAGTATWLGLPLHTLLARARPRPGADMVLSSSSDGFSASTPIEAVTDPDRGALLAIGMNGRPLPLEHGFPVRMVVPGLYGFVSATKWVVDLEVTRFADATAYWTDRGWAQRAPIKTASRIDVPRGLARVPAGQVAVGGVAWAQTRGIDRVEVRVDGGPWHEATLAAEDGVDTWRQWSYAWDAAPGPHALSVRATDRTGATQPSERVDPIPDGATGWHTVQVTVV